MQQCNKKLHLSVDRTIGSFSFSVSVSEAGSLTDASWHLSFSLSLSLSIQTFFRPAASLSLRSGHAAAEAAAWRLILGIIPALFGLGFHWGAISFTKFINLVLRSYYDFNNSFWVFLFFYLCSLQSFFTNLFGKVWFKPATFCRVVCFRKLGRFCQKWRTVCVLDVLTWLTARKNGLCFWRAHISSLLWRRLLQIGGKQKVIVSRKKGGRGGGVWKSGEPFA